MVRFERRLHVDAETAGQLEGVLMPLLESPTVIVTDAYPFPLAAEIVEDGVQVRAATGDEVTAFLTVGDATNPDDFQWPGDPPWPTGRDIEWQESQDSYAETDRSCRLWNGEVILFSGRCAASPFFVHEAAARSWAFSAALAAPERDVFVLQVVPYNCARRLALGLIMGGDAEFARLNRFWISPVRSSGQVGQFSLPGAES